MEEVEIWKVWSRRHSAKYPDQAEWKEQYFPGINSRNFTEVQSTPIGMKNEKCVQQPSPISPNRPESKKNKSQLFAIWINFINIITNAQDSLNTFLFYLRNMISILISFPFKYRKWVECSFSTRRIRRMILWWIWTVGMEFLCRWLTSAMKVPFRAI